MLPSPAGTPDKPTLSQAAGSNAATASISVSKVFTATNYTVTLVDVRSPANTASEVLSPPASEDGPWTSTLTAPAKGTYRFEVWHWCGAGGPECACLVVVQC